jgi:hypothetical protein
MPFKAADLPPNLPGDKHAPAGFPFYDFCHFAICTPLPEARAGASYA